VLERHAALAEALLPYAVLAAELAQLVRLASRRLAQLVGEDD
jgi:hypothetical protein